MAVERVEITGIAAGGAGVGRLADGRAVFVHRTAPGDVARVRVTRRRARWATADLVALDRAAAGRRAAPCPHYDRCGGCTLEHLEYPHQLEAKRTMAEEALRRIGGLEPPPVGITGSPQELRYRNRVSFTLRRLRGGRAVAGFHELGRPDRILDVDGRCLLPEPAVAEAWDGLRRAWGPGAGRLPAGAELRLTLRGTAAGRVALLIEGGTDDERAADARALLDDVAPLAAIWHRPDGEIETRRLAGDAILEEPWGGELVRLAGTAFLQVNRSAAALLEARVLELAGDVAGRHVVDAYCGVGIHARRLARAGARVTGIELDPHAVAEARRSPPGATILEGAVEDRLAEALPADLLVVNPPRGGLDARVADAIAEAAVPRVIYVSCDPATLARDLRRLDPALRLRSVHCFDLFPQTSHVETVVELACATS